MITWLEIIRKDNERGVLAGLDKRGQPLLPVTYRPLKPGGIKTTREQRQGRKASQRGIFAGFGPAAAGWHNNLTSSEYRQLGGPPLAPRGRYSRVITNLKTEADQITHQQSGSGSSVWTAYAYWDQVVSVKGERFLHFHFHGIGQKQRDLTGVRPEGLQAARTAAVNWLRDMVRSGGV